MKKVRLTRSDRELLQRGSGPLGERLVSENYQGYSRAFAENFDVATESGSVGEVKTTVAERSSGASGRFRVFKSQHTELRRIDRSGVAGYFFVLIDTSADRRRDMTAKMVRKSVSDVGRIVTDAGGWYDAGHSSGPERKLPIGAIF